MYGVSPADVTQCGSRIHEVSAQWGTEATRLAEAVVGPPWGSGRIASAIEGLRTELQPPTRDYVDQTGYCLAEVSVAVHSMADAYRRTEETNTGQSDRILDVLVQLGAA